MIRIDAQDVQAACAGDRAALATVLQAVERPVHALALRMLAHPADAEDATQEILIRVMTGLGTLRDPAAAGGWALRIASRHLVRTRQRSRVEAMRLDFDAFAADLVEGQSPLEGTGLSAPEAALAIEEVRTGCTLAMLTCLSRDLRIAYVLGEVFEMTDAEAAPVLGITADAFRQRLSRARTAVIGFTGAACGMVSENASCRCERRVGPALRQGRIARGKTGYPPATTAPVETPVLRREIRRLDAARASAALMRATPQHETAIRELVLALAGPPGAQSPNAP